MGCSLSMPRSLAIGLARWQARVIVNELPPGSLSLVAASGRERKYKSASETWPSSQASLRGRSAVGHGHELAVPARTRYRCLAGLERVRSWAQFGLAAQVRNDSERSPNNERGEFKLDDMRVGDRPTAGAGPCLAAGHLRRRIDTTPARQLDQLDGGLAGRRA